MNISELLKDRRSVYQLGKEIPVSDDEVIKLVSEVTEQVPDAFNMKSQRVVLAFGEKHEALWDAIYDVFRGKVAREKIDSFKAGHGTVLYFYDAEVVKGLQEQYKFLSSYFPTWVQQANGMLQISIWTGLRELGIGANIQHYNPVIDETVRTLFDLPESYVMVAQMPFGEIKQAPAPKEKEEIANRVRVIR